MYIKMLNRQENSVMKKKLLLTLYLLVYERIIIKKLE